MKYVEIHFDISPASSDSSEGYRSLTFEIEWMNNEARGVSYGGKEFEFEILSLAYPAATAASLYLNGTERMGSCIEPCLLENAYMAVWMGTCLESLLYWDLICEKSEKIKKKEVVDRKSSLSIDGAKIFFDREIQRKLYRTLLTGGRNKQYEIFYPINR